MLCASYGFFGSLSTNPSTPKPHQYPSQTRSSQSPSKPISIPSASHRPPFCGTSTASTSRFEFSKMRDKICKASESGQWFQTTTHSTVPPPPPAPLPSHVRPTPSLTICSHLRLSRERPFWGRGMVSDRCYAFWKGKIQGGLAEEWLGWGPTNEVRKRIAERTARLEGAFRWLFWVEGFLCGREVEMMDREKVKYNKSIKTI